MYLKNVCKLYSVYNYIFQIQGYVPPCKEEIGKDDNNKSKILIV